MSLQVKKVELKSRPDLDLYVRSFSALEAFQHQEEMAAVPDTGKDTVAAMLSVYVANSDGSRKFPTIAEAFEFMATVKNGVVKRLISEGQKFNAITDEAIEEEQKN